MTQKHETAARAATAAAAASTLIALTATQPAPYTAKEDALTDHAEPTTNPDEQTTPPTTTPPNPNTNPNTTRERQTLHTPTSPPPALAALLARPIEDARTETTTVVLDTYTPPAALDRTQTTTTQRLAYRDLVQGQGPPASATNTLTIHIAAAHLHEPQSPAIYRDTQADNTPITLSPADPGLTRALQLTLPGARRGTTRLIESGPRWNTNLSRPGIPENTTHRFAVTVINIER